MPAAKSRSIYRNLICVAIALLLLFTTAIFVLTGLYQHQIDQLIDNATLLKDHKYPNWGAFSSNQQAKYQHILTLNNLSPGQQLDSRVDPIGMDFEFSYKSVSFGQGDQGTIKYLNNWHRSLNQQQSQSEGKQKMSDRQITTVNLAVQRLYSYEYYSPLSRQFVLNFNFMWQSIKDMLPRVYGLYLHQFYLHDPQVVAKAIFDPANVPASARQQLMNHPTYGWQQPEHLAPWFKLVHLQDHLKEEHPLFQLISEALQMSHQQLMVLIDKKSALFKLSSALNGTLKNKVEANSIGYQGCVPFCSDDQLVALQLTTGYLTNAPLMGSISLGKLIHDLNSSYPRAVQYSAFCQSRPDLTCIDQKNAIITFSQKVYNNFTLMSKVIENIGNFELVETIFEVQNPMGDGSYGQSLVEYLRYLSSQVYTPYDQQQDHSDHEAYRLMFPNYEYLLKSMDYFRSALSIQLLSLAGSNLIRRHNFTCLSFFQGNYQEFASLCDGEETDPTHKDTFRLFVQAHLLMEPARSNFINITGMDPTTARQFLRLDTSNSLFAEMLRNIKTDLAKSLNCKGAVCTELQLVAREWGGSNTVLDKLPKAYFPEGQLHIFEIDYDQQFREVDPRFWKIIGTTLPQDQSMSLLGNGDQSILVLLNLGNYASKFYKDTLATSLVRYVQRLVIDTYFGGYYIKKDIHSLIYGYSAEAIALKQQMQPSRGGASWLSNSLSIIEMNHSPRRFSKINSGIYDKDKLRAVIQVEGEGKASSEYTVYQADFEQVVETLRSSKAVKGTNMLGFHQGVAASEKLNVQLDFLNYGATLSNGKECIFQKGSTPALNFSLSQADTNSAIAVGIQEQNQRYAKMDPSSYLVLEPITGLTLEIYFKYSVYGNLTTIGWYRDGQPSELKLFDVEVKYRREDLKSMDEIRSQKSEMNTLTIIMIICDSLSMALVIVFGVLYLRARKAFKRTDIMESLASAEVTI